MQFGSKSTGYNNQEVFLLSDLLTHNRAVGRSENSGGPVLFGGHNLPPLVEIGLTDLPKSGGAMAPPAPPGTTGLHNKTVGNTSRVCVLYIDRKQGCCQSDRTV